MSHYELRSSINTHFAAARFAPRFYRFNDTSCLVNDDLCECLRYVSFFRIDVKKKNGLYYIVISKENSEHEKAIKDCDELIKNDRIVTFSHFNQ